MNEDSSAPELTTVYVAFRALVNTEQHTLCARVTPETLAQMTADWRQHESEPSTAAAAVGHGSQPRSYEVHQHGRTGVLLVRWADVLYVSS